MKNACTSNVYIIILILLAVSCREPLVSSADERKEELIQGSWIFANEAGTILLNFMPDLTVDIFNSTDGNEYTYNFRIEDGFLILSLTDTYHDITPPFHIDTLTQFQLVLSFVGSGGQIVTQTYERPL